MVSVVTATPVQPQEDFMEGGQKLSTDVDVMIRHGFVRKVYGILSVQLIVTFGMCFAISQWLKPECLAGTGLCTGIFWGSWILSIVLLIAIFCCKENAKIFPRNYLLLGAYTLCTGLMLGAISAYYTLESVMVAAGMTTVVVVALTFFACQTKYDFTGMGAYLFAALISLCVFGLVAMLINIPFLRKLYALIGCLVFSLYIVFDTQLIMGCNKFGKAHRYSFGVDEYIWATLNLYIDIVQMFLFILALTGDRE